LLIAGFATGLTGASNSMRVFSLGRFFSGFGYGGLLPVVNAYLTEFSSIRIRGLYLALLESSWAIGSILIGGFTMLTLVILLACLLQYSPYIRILSSS